MNKTILSVLTLCLLVSVTWSAPVSTATHRHTPSPPSAQDGTLTAAQKKAILCKKWCAEGSGGNFCNCDMPPFKYGQQ